MKRLVNKLVQGIIFGSLIALPSFGFSQMNSKTNFPERYSSVAEIRKEVPAMWRGFTREYVPIDLRFELLNEFSNLDNPSKDYSLKLQGSMQKSFKFNNFEPYLGAGLVYRNYNPSYLKVNTTFVGGIDVIINKNLKLYLQSSKEFKHNPELWVGIIRKL